MLSSGGTRRSWLTPLVAALLALVLVATACSSSSSNDAGSAGTVNQAAPTDEGPPTPGGTLRVGVGAELDSLNPVSARWSLEGNLMGSSIYDSLMTFDANRNLVPRLAESMTPNADGTVWTIKLKSGISFQNGEPFDADAVKMNIDARKAQPVTGSALDPVESVQVVDPLTVQVNMNRPWFGYDYTTAAQGGFMVAPAAIQADDPTVAIGTGPFELDGSWSPGQPVKVKRNDNYWGDKAYLDGIVFTSLVDQTSRAAALRSGDVDMILTEDPASVKSFRDSPGFIQVEDFGGAETFAMLNFSKPPFDNIHARKALAYGTDRQAVNDSVGGGIQADADQPYTQSEAYYVADSHYPTYDPAKAQEEIDAYKADTGESSLSFTLSTPISNQQKAEAELLQAQWSALGMDVKIDDLDQSAFLAAAFGGNFQAAMFQNFAYVNPDSNYIFWHSSYAKEGGGINFGLMRIPALDQALDTARSTPDPAQRIEEIKKAVVAINDNVGYIWLFHTDWGLAASDKVGGLNAAKELGFARQDAKPWWPQIWLKQS